MTENWSKDDRVKGNYKGWGVWYKAKIEHVNDDGTTYDLRYDDGIIEKSVDFHQIRPESFTVNFSKSSSAAVSSDPPAAVSSMCSYINLCMAICILPSVFFAGVAPFFILTNDPQTNVFRYPAFVALQGSGDRILQSGCTLTSCWTQPEDEVSWTKGRLGDDFLAAAIESEYDEGKIVHNSYTAASCVSRQVDNIPRDANFCEICASMRTWNFQGALFMIYSWIVLVPVGLVLKTIASDELKKKPTGKTYWWKEKLGNFIIAFAILVQPALGISIGINFTACRDSYLAFLKFTKPAVPAHVRYGIGGNLFFVGIAGWIFIIVYYLWYKYWEKRDKLEKLKAEKMKTKAEKMKYKNTSYISAGVSQGNVKRNHTTFSSNPIREAEAGNAKFAIDDEEDLHTLD